MRKVGHYRAKAKHVDLNRDRFFSRSHGPRHIRRLLHKWLLHILHQPLLHLLYGLFHSLRIAYIVWWIIHVTSLLLVLLSHIKMSQTYQVQLIFLSEYFQYFFLDRLYPPVYGRLAHAKRK